MENVVSQKPMRLIWLDQLKAVSMYIVVLGHTLLDFNKHKLFKFIYSFHMPLFFMISGFTFNPDKYERIIDCIKDKVIKLAYPYVMLNILVIPLWFINMETGMIGKDSIPKILLGIFYSNSSVVRAPSNATWFIMTLLLAEIIYYAVYHFLHDDKSVFLMSGILCLLGVLAPLGNEVVDAPLHLDVSLVAQFFYGCGYLLRKNFNYIKSCFCGYTYLKLIMLVMTGLFFSIINKQVDLSNELYRNFVYTLISSFTISVSMFYVFSRIKLYPKIMSYIGRNTIIILAFHIPVMRVIQAYCPFFNENQMNAILLSFIVFALMLPTIWIVKQCFPFMIKMPDKIKDIVERV